MAATRGEERPKSRASLRAIGLMLASVGLAVVTILQPARARVAYDPVLDWDGPTFRAENASTVDQLVDSPPIDVPFLTPTAVAAREHSGRDVVYVVDGGRSRVQAFEVNATYLYRSQADLTWAATASAASQWDSDQILLPEWAASATRFVVPRSEILWVNGVRWTRVADLTGFTAADHVYRIDDSDASNAPELQLPANSLNASSHFALRYLLSEEHSGAAATFGIGDVDYGIGAGASPLLVTISESSGGPTSWQMVRSIAAIENEVTSSTDDLFLLDTDDSSVGGDERLFEFSVADDGILSYVEAYDDYLTGPYDVAVGRSGASIAASASLNNDSGPFDSGTVAIVDASQVTGHTYDITVSGGTDCTITDRTTGTVLVSNATFTQLASPCYAVPGISLQRNPAAGSSNVLSTTRAISNRYLFVADTGNDRIKVLAAGDGVGASWPGDWLPGDAHSPAEQPTGAGSVGATQDVDYWHSTPATVPEDYTVFTNAAPVKEASLQTITFDPGGSPDVWVVTPDLSEALSTAKVFEVDWLTGRVLFGDGVHGRIPPSSTTFQFTYSTSPDALHYGSTGSGTNQLSGPRGVAARWNTSLGAYDLYVADTGNDRMVKLAFYPEVSGQHLPARMQWITSWSTATSASDSLDAPSDAVVEQDGDGAVWLAVSDAGSDRVILYRDTAATSGGGGTPPRFDNVLGGSGESIGSFDALASLAFLSNGSDLDLYAVDADRNRVTKFEESPQAAIALDLTGPSALPDCYPPTGAYLFRFTTTNAPESGWIDLYYDSAATFHPSSAHRCVASGSVGANATQAVWPIDASPGGTPSDSDGYYLYAVLRDSSGVEVARDQTDADQLLCVESSIVPTVRIGDAIDGDRTLYLQNGLERTILLQVAYPDSVVAASFAATFDPTLIEVTGVTPGNGWDGTGFSNTVFTSDWSNTTGSFSVNSSAIGAPIGLVTPGPHTLARVSLRTKNALSSSTRVRNGTLTLSTATSGMHDVHNHAPASWRAASLSLRLGYLGDLASDASGADSVVPYLMPKPDGKINFADQVAFTAGWNGANARQDRIADIGPVEGIAPDLISSPDNRWDIDDILAFTTMYSWANPSDALTEGGGANRGASSASRASKSTLARPVIAGVAREGAELEGIALDDAALPVVVSDCSNPMPGALAHIDIDLREVACLTGARLIVGFDPAKLELLEIADGGFLRGDEGGLFFQRRGEDWVEISSTRLDRHAPASKGSGTLAGLSFRILDPAELKLSLEYDLRGAAGEPIALGSREVDPLLGSGFSFELREPWPNPAARAARLAFSLPESRDVSLELFDSGGRRVRSLVDGPRDAGAHVLRFDGRDERGARIPAGLYFVRLRAGGEESRRKLVWLR